MRSRPSIPFIALITLGLFVLTTLLIPATPRAAGLTDSDPHRSYLPLVLHTLSADEALVLAARRQVIALVNVERVASGCAAASENSILMHATQAWSTSLAATQTITHTSAYPGDWYAEHGWHAPILGENIGLGNRNEVVHHWMSSPAHRAALLACDAGPAYRYEIGVGFDSYGWILAISAE